MLNHDCLFTDSTIHAFLVFRRLYIYIFKGAIAISIVRYQCNTSLSIIDTFTVLSIQKNFPIRYRYTSIMIRTFVPFSARFPTFNLFTSIFESRLLLLLSFFYFYYFNSLNFKICHSKIVKLTTFGGIVEM